MLVFLFLLFPNFLLKIDKLHLCFSDKTGKNMILLDLYSLVIAYFFFRLLGCICAHF